jgi:hypothetical protein
MISLSLGRALQKSRATGFGALEDGPHTVFMYGARRLAQTSPFDVCDLPKASFAESCGEMPRPPP